MTDVIIFSIPANCERKKAVEQERLAIANKGKQQIRVAESALFAVVNLFISFALGA